MDRSKLVRRPRLHVVYTNPLVLSFYSRSDWLNLPATALKRDHDAVVSGISREPQRFAGSRCKR